MYMNGHGHLLRLGEGHLHQHHRACKLSLTHSLTHSLPHSLTYSHSLTHTPSLNPRTGTRTRTCRPWTAATASARRARCSSFAW